ADMGRAVEIGPWRQRFRRHAHKSMAEPFLDQDKEFLHAHAIDDVFQPRLEPVGAVAEIDEDANDRVRYLGGIFGPDDNVGIPGKIPVSGDATDTQAKPYSGLDAKAVPHLDRRARHVVAFF